jgi:muramoyltetrapeptide carboxypeptidase
MTLVEMSGDDQTPNPWDHRSMELTALTEPDLALMPALLRTGDTVRFVSPASTPDREWVFRGARVLESWGLKVELGDHVFAKAAYLAGTDEQRLADFNAALRDPGVRAVIATGGGKGSYRIADRLDFAAARSDPKFVVGFSDITVLHLSLWRQCRLIGVHGSLMPDGQNGETLRRALMTSEGLCLHSRADEQTSAMTTKGTATGRLIGGNLETISAAAGWSLPSLKGAILLIEAVNMFPGQIDRQLTMLRKAGHLTGLAGIAVGQFTDCFKPIDGFTVVDLLRDHLEQLEVPILGGLPLGHGHQPQSTLVGAMAFLDAAAGTLTISKQQTTPETRLTPLG